MIIYKITNQKNGKIYVGQTVKPLMTRWAVHKCAKRRSPLSSSIKKHGAAAFIIEVIYRASRARDLDALEKKFIAQYDCLYPKGYNLLPGGNVSQNRGRPSWNKGKKASKKARLNQSLSHLGRTPWNKGIPITKSAKEKMSAAKRGKRVSRKTEFKRGKPSAFKGRTHNSESLAKISENGNRRAIICLETGAVYSSILAASSELQIAKSHLRRLVISGRKSGGGFSFKFL